MNLNRLAKLLAYIIGAKKEILLGFSLIAEKQFEHSIR